ncbi:uncharacterized protein isoform X3 [Castor canadensis]|uniref:Uncharacterized protein isoform X3 n=1 Tax=Castor canadensis TaxID=51338 RepID=A0AC58K3B2_CASCN
MRSKRINLEGNTHAQEINRLMGQTPAASFNMKKNRCSEINQFSMRTWTRTEMMKLAPVYPRIQGLQRKDSPLFCLMIIFHLMPKSFRRSNNSSSRQLDFCLVFFENQAS